MTLRPPAIVTRLKAAALAGLLALPAQAADSVTDQAAAAAAALQNAIAALDTAETSHDRVEALTRTIRAYEDGLATLREALRQAELRETTLTLQFEAKRAYVAQLLGTLSTLEATPGPLLLLHPSGPLGTARSGMMLAEVTPALQAEVETLKSEVQELNDLRALEASATETLAKGLTAAQTARTELSKAISDRVDLPKKFTEDPEALQGLLTSADTLEAFAQGLVPDYEADGATFESAKGTLPLPVLGTLLRRADEADAAGVRLPGISLAVAPRALVTSPWAATIRYVGPLLDYGNVMILEPGGGYLLILGGLGTVYGAVGDVVAAAAPLGLMPGGDPAVDEFLASVADGGGARDSETLYMELRLDGEPVDPAAWFAATKE